MTAGRKLGLFLSLLLPIRVEAELMKTPVAVE